MRKGKSCIGTSGFYYSSWIGDFYPKDIQKDNLLTFYNRYFNTVEINSSFYHIPKATTVVNWENKVSKNFSFCFKASRLITHIKKLRVDQDIIHLFFAPLQVFATYPPRHLVLFQTPSNLKANMQRLRELFTFLPKTFLYAFEFRDGSWFHDDIYAVLQNNNAALVLSDSPFTHGEDRLWPYYDVDTADFAYIRFHGSKRLYFSSYTDSELYAYKELIRQKNIKGSDVYCYFNNDAGGFATQNALKLKEYLDNFENV